MRKTENPVWGGGFEYLIFLANPPYFPRELGIGIVAYCPLGRGFFALGATVAENLPNDDARKVHINAYHIPFNFHNID